MKSNTKWIIGIAVTLLVICLVVGAAGAVISMIGGICLAARNPLRAVVERRAGSVSLACHADGAGAVPVDAPDARHQRRLV